jgi:hypothetical protein
MNKRKRVAAHKHRVVAQKVREKRKAQRTTATAKK